VAALLPTLSASYVLTSQHAGCDKGMFVVRTSETGLALGPSYGLSFSSTLGSWFQRPRL